MGKLDFLRKAIRNKVSEFHTWRSLDGKYIYLYRTILFYYGFWPALENTHSQRFSKFRYWNPRLVLVVWINNSLIIFPMTLYMASGESTVALMEPIIFEFVAIIMTCISICLIYRSDTFEATVKAFEATRECARLLPERPQHIVDRGRRLNDALFWIVSTLWVLAIIAIFAPLPFLVRKRELYLRIWASHDIRVSPTYELNLVLWVYHLWMDVHFALPMGVLLVSLLAEAVQDFDMLNYNLGVLKHSAIRLSSESSSRGASHNGDVGTEMAAILRSCVQHHQAIISYVSVIERCYNFIISLLLVGFLTTAGIGIAAMPYVEVLTSSMIIQLMLVLCALLALTWAFYLSNRITEQNDQVKDSVFGSDWITESASFKRSMCIIIARSNTPLVMKVSGFVQVSQETCREVFYLTYKFYMFVRDLNQLADENIPVPAISRGIEKH